MRGALMLLASISLASVAAKTPSIEQQYAKELQAVADTTRDPNAVQFRKIHVGADGALCGEMNAKNAFGGYVGFKPFLVRNGAILIVTDEGREQRKDLSDKQWAWERLLDQKEFDEACGASAS
jgi:hypothetical protein